MHQPKSFAQLREEAAESFRETSNEWRRAIDRTTKETLELIGRLASLAAGARDFQEQAATAGHSLDPEADATAYEKLVEELTAADKARLEMLSLLGLSFISDETRTKYSEHLRALESDSEDAVSEAA